MKCSQCHFENPEDSHFCSKCGTQIHPSEKISSPQTKTIQAPIKELTIGSTFADRFQVIEELGKGGMGEVYKVFDKKIKEKVALKLLNHEIAADEKAIERFRNELKYARKISHRNVCRMFDLSEEEGTQYIIMEYVPGEDLKGTIRRVGQLSVGKAISISKQVCEGLAEAHRLGVVHRDLKPQNIMVDREGNARIMDFGIARSIKTKGITGTGVMIGTPDYMSPEQVEGKEVDHRSDIYALGVILYEMVTGGVPFEGDTPLSVIVKHKSEAPPDPKEVNAQIPIDLSRMILRCLEKDKERRYQKAGDILSELIKIEKEIPTKEKLLEIRKSYFRSFLQKLKERKIIETLAAFIGGGMLAVEFGHWILVNHYHLPKVIVDITLAAVLCAMISTVIWRWTRGVERKRRKISILPKLKLKWAVALIVIAFMIFGGYHLWRGFIQPQYDYEPFILLEVSTGKTQEIQKNLIEYLLYRSITASTNLYILIQEDFTTYKRTTEAKEIKSKRPLIEITGEVSRKVMGFEISILMRNKEKTTPWKKFECKGPYDLISDKIEKIHSFISGESDGVIGKIERDRTFSQICTDNLDALGHFLEGEEAWKKIDTEAAHSEYKTAIEIDPEFSLAYLKIADVLLFKVDREDAKRNLQIAWEKKDKLIKYDLFRLKALRARINFKPVEERQHIGRLKEAFPFKKEYRYEFAESYFHWGEPDEAIKHYSSALEIDPNYSLAHNHIAFCYSWIGNHKLAEEHFNKYVELDNTANSYDSLACGYMFAGRYDEAIKALKKGKVLRPNLDYLYASLANIFIQKGLLTEAVRTLKEEETITEGETTKANIHFYLAYIEFLRGNIEKSIQELRDAIVFYSSEFYADNVDEASNLPFWLTGVIAAQRKDLNGLREVINKMEKKIEKKEVNATNYFPIYKFYIHLKLLEGYLHKDMNIIKTYIREGKRIRKKMGFWTSMFDLAYFFDKYAEILIKHNMSSEPLELLTEVIEYNPNYISSHLNMAKIHLNNNNMEEARKEYQKALELLSDADKDYTLVREAESIGKKILPLAISD
ncbi:Serine/threonine-protein kinase PknD [subsurface metagenome]